MSKRKKQYAPRTETKTVESPAPGKKKKHPGLQRLGAALPYLLTFLLAWIFCTAIYGDVFTRAQQDSYVSANAETMKYLTDQAYGQLYWWGRYLLLVYKSALLGGLLLALLLTAATYCLDRFLCLPRWLRGISAIPAFALLWWMVSRGYSLFYKNEPSVIVLYPLALALIAAAAAGLTVLVKRFARKGAADKAATPAGLAQTAPTPLWKRLPYGCLVPAACFAALTAYTLSHNENEILTARMQNRVLTGEADEIALLVDDGLSARQPSRSVAAYYAVGLMQTGQLLEHIFDIPYKYPEMPLDEKDGSEEYGIFETDCNFFVGLTNASYRAGMDHIVMNGPRLYQLKRMALCALVNHENQLAEKYLKLISEMPFEQSFVERYRPMLTDSTLIDADPVLSQVRKLRPEEQRFEQNYRRPIFMGYNIGLLSGSNEAIDASIAACLYSKDLNNAYMRIAVLPTLKRPLPSCAQEALVILGLKQPAVFEQYPDLSPQAAGRPGSAYATVQSFIADIQKFYQEKYGNAADWQEKMKADLKGGIPEDVRDYLATDWMGHYVYYYYCENIKTKDNGENKNKSGVN